MDNVTNEVISQMLGRQLRQLRESRGWTRPELARRLPSKITEHTLLTYEHGIRQCSLVRLVEICRILEVPTSDVVQVTLQQAGVDLEILSLRVDLRAVIRDKDAEFLPVRRWARNRLAEEPEGRGIVRLIPETVHEMAAVVGCSHSALVTYLVKFTPDVEPTRDTPP